MQENPHTFNRGFTLVELMVVVAIISLLSSIVFSSLGTARAKARDTKAITEFNQIKIALALYFDKYGRYPNETSVGGGNVGGYYTENFDSMADQLVAEKFLSSRPVAPINHRYGYYNYLNYDTDAIPPQKAGAQLITSLETKQPSTTGLSGSCRPWNANWCSNTIPSTDYCICNPY